jgi:hypothetical protein
VDFFTARREGTHALYVEMTAGSGWRRLPRRAGAAQGAPKTEGARAPPAEEIAPGEMEPGLPQ